MSCKTALFGSIALILGWNSTALAQTAGEPWEGFAGGFGVGYMHQEAKGLTASTGLFFDRGVRGSGPFTGASDLVSSMQTAGVAVSRTADHGSSKDSSAFSLFGVYNQRFDTFVAGIEASAVFGGASVKSIDRIAIDLAHLSGHAAGVDTAAFSVQGEAKNPWFVTLAPRLGVPAGDALLFAQAGVAVGRVEANWNRHRNHLCLRSQDRQRFENGDRISSGCRRGIPPCARCLDPRRLHVCEHAGTRHLQHIRVDSSAPHWIRRPAASRGCKLWALNVRALAPCRTTQLRLDTGNLRPPFGGRGCLTKLPGLGRLAEDKAKQTA